MEFIRVLWKYSKKDTWMDANHWLLWALLGGLFPLWGGLLGTKLLSQNVNFENFTAHGEFVLYGASFSGTSLYLILRQKRWFPNRSLVAFLFVAFIGISACVYATVVAETVLGTQLKLDRSFITLLGYILFVLAGALSYLMVVVDNILTSIDFQQISQSQVDHLSEEFDSLEDQ